MATLQPGMVSQKAFTHIHKQPYHYSGIVSGFLFYSQLYPGLKFTLNRH
jgi:hypothetical protein